MMSTLIGDIAARRIEPMEANAICRAGGALLRIVELQYKYGVTAGDEKHLQLAPGSKA